jgi:hypothetical protein
MNKTVEFIETFRTLPESQKDYMMAVQQAMMFATGLKTIPPEDPSPYANDRTFRLAQQYVNVKEIENKRKGA